MNPLEATTLLKYRGFQYLRGGSFVIPTRKLETDELKSIAFLSDDWDYEFITRPEYLNALQNNR